MPAPARELDFRFVPEHPLLETQGERTKRYHTTVPVKLKKGVEAPTRKNGNPKSLNRKQIRARARRKKRRGEPVHEEIALLYGSIDTWDLEELARGRPRDKDGGFEGTVPDWITREVYEEALARFKRIVQGDLRAEAAGALDVIHSLINDNKLDAKGKPMVPASVKADLSKWLIEHIVGKPTQRVEQDISVRLQAVLAQAMIQPGVLPELLPGEAASAFVDVEVEDAEEVDDVD